MGGRRKARAGGGDVERAGAHAVSFARQAGRAQRASGSSAGDDAVLAALLSRSEMVTARTRATLNTAAAAARDAVGGVADLDAGGRADRAAGEALSSALAWSVLRTVADPEIPVLSVVELGIVRAIEIACDRKTVTVTVTPTYIGCPATEMIAQDIVRALTDAGAVQVVVRQQLAPAWSTDWIEPAARERMRAYGIVPPAAQSPHARLEQPLRFVARESVRVSAHESTSESAHESVRA